MMMNIYISVKNNKNKNYYLLLFFLAIVCFPNNSALGILNRAFVYARYSIAIICLILFIKNKLYRVKFLIPLYLLFGWCTFTTLINGCPFVTYIKYFTPFFASAVLTYLLIKIDIVRAYSDIATILAIILILQFLTFLFNPFGYITEGGYRLNYLLGNRVSINKILFFAIYFSVSNIKISKKSGILKTIIVLFTGLIFVFGEKVSTSIVGTFIYTFIFIFSRIIKSKRMWRNIVILIIVLAISFAFIGNMEYFQYLLVDILDEGMTMSGRTLIWEQAINNLHGIHWLIGNGYGNDYQFYLRNVWASGKAHNQYLSTIFNYGLIGLFFYIILYNYQFRSAINESKKININLLSCLITMLIIQIPASTYDMVYFYIFYIASCYAPLLEK